MTDNRLLEAYLNTTFVAFAPETEIRIRVGERNPFLEDLLALHGVSTWAFITAFNPASVSLGSRENELRQNRLEVELAKRYVLLPGLGKSDAGNWPAERSVLVLGIARDDAVRVGQRYGQNAIVVGAVTGLPELLWIQ